MKVKLMLQRTCLQLVSLLMLFISIGVSDVKAVTVIPDSPCDALYYETLSARAWLEAQREITQNQNLILKPDSVFEYTCFDMLVKELADHGTEMLSETSAFGTPLSSTSLDNSLTALVISSLSAYHSANFGYYTGLLGGHTAATAIYHNIPSTIGGINATYNCDIMERVWHAAKCLNFASNSTTEGFFTLAEYANPLAPDKRTFPSVCTPLIAQWGANLTTALTTGPWTNDPVQTYMAQLTPPTCPTTGTCSCSSGQPAPIGEPIPTGLRVVRTGTGTTVTDYEEHICLQPGCRYHPGGILYGTTTATAGCYGR
ncbi:MAG: hypothetical protein COB14_09375 [Alphaproteobacteria bacterium]|nr:MAG: hypothetical protein COB14_09375 [Alphaproteobacteria bacterium]